MSPFRAVPEAGILFNTIERHKKIHFVLDGIIMRVVVEEAHHGIATFPGGSETSPRRRLGVWH
jgi:hypothetical protein